MGERVHLPKAIERLEARLHTPAWRAAVERCRQVLGLPVTNEDGLEAWLGEKGQEPFITVCAEHYEEFRVQERLPSRLLAYFAACVLSHHTGGTVAHTAPKSLGLSAAVHRRGRPSPYVGLWFRPDFRSLRNSRWEFIEPPLGFEILWPKVPFLYLRSDLSAEVSVPEFSLHLSDRTTWSYVVVENYCSAKAGYLQEGRYLAGPPIAGKSLRELLQVPPDIRILPTRLVIPVVLPQGLAVGISLNPGAVLNLKEWLEPRVQRDLMMEDWEEKLAADAEKSVRALWLLPSYRWESGGRPRRMPPAPGMPYSVRVQRIYEELLPRERHRPTPRTLQRLRRTARREALREYADPSQRDELPERWWELVERREPWRRGRRQAPLFRNGGGAKGGETGYS